MDHLCRALQSRRPLNSQPAPSRTPWASPLPVVAAATPRESCFPPTTQLSRMSSESPPPRLGFSETVFITSIRPAANASTCDVALRYFTPTDEVELCGHATIACIGLLHELPLAFGGAKRGTLHTRAGSVAFEIRPSPSGLDVANDAYVLDGDTGHLTASAAPGRDMVYMQQLAPVLDEPLDESLEEEVACALFPEEEGSEGEGSPPRSNGGNGYGAGKKERSISSTRRGRLASPPPACAI